MKDLRAKKASLRVMEKNGARSIGYWIALLGNLVVCIGLLLNGFEIVSHTGFRIIVLIGVIIDFVALFFIWKKSEL